MQVFGKVEDELVEKGAAACCKPVFLRSQAAQFVLPVAYYCLVCFIAVLPKERPEYVSSKATIVLYSSYVASS